MLRLFVANEEGNDSKEKMVTATKKGSAVLDQWLPDHIKTHYHVLQLVSYLVLNIGVNESIAFCGW